MVMKPATIEKLEALNEAFYARHAQAFSNTRTAPWPGWGTVQVADDASVLDLGCGNGRYLAFLQSRGFVGKFLGVDSCAALVERATEMFPPSQNVRWQVARLNEALRFDTEFDHVTAWGVLHHVPAQEQREQVIARMLKRTKPGGTLWFSLWQFRDHERFAKHECTAADLAFGEGELEDGDALLDWQGDRDVPRYCHHFSDEEIARICHRFGEANPSVHRSEGADRFNAYVCLRRR